MVSNGKATVRREQNKIIFVGNLKQKDLYEIEFFVNFGEIKNNRAVCRVACIADMVDDFDVNLWHCRLRHLGIPSLEKLRKEKLVEGLENIKILDDCCEAC